MQDLGQLLGQHLQALRDGGGAVEQPPVRVRASDGEQLQRAAGEVGAPVHPVGGDVERRHAVLDLRQAPAQVVDDLRQAQPQERGAQTVQEQRGLAALRLEVELLEVHPGEVRHGGADVTGVEPDAGPHRAGRRHPLRPAALVRGPLQGVAGLHAQLQRCTGPGEQCGPAVQGHEQDLRVRRRGECGKELFEALQHGEGIAEAAREEELVDAPEVGSDPGRRRRRVAGGQGRRGGVVPVPRPPAHGRTLAVREETACRRPRVFGPPEWSRRGPAP